MVIQFGFCNAPDTFQQPIQVSSYCLSSVILVVPFNGDAVWLLKCPQYLSAPLYRPLSYYLSSVMYIVSIVPFSGDDLLQCPQYLSTLIWLYSPVSSVKTSILTVVKGYIRAVISRQDQLLRVATALKMASYLKFKMTKRQQPQTGHLEYLTTHISCVAYFFKAK